MREIWRLFLKLKWKPYSFKDAFVQPAGLNWVFRESPALWNLHCGRKPSEKIATSLLYSAERSAWVCVLPPWPRSPPASQEAPGPRDLLIQGIIKVPQEVSLLTGCAERSWNENMGSEGKRSLIQKKKKKKAIWFGSTLSGSFQTSSACSLCPEEIPA